MKRVLLGLVLLAGGAVLGGCPIYSSQGYSSQGEYTVCSGSQCYSCPDPSYSGACTPYACQSDGDCPSPYVCDPNAGVCVSSSGYGSEGGSDCGTTGCPSGQVCKLANGVAACVTLGSSGDDASTGSDSSTTDSGSGGGDSSAANDSSDGSDGNTTITGPCNNDATCGGHGEKCIDGQCTVQGELCSDGSQCVVTGSACVDGACEPTCSASAPCPQGTACDLTRGVCNIIASACTGSGTSTCAGGTTCVEGACVPPCTTTDGGEAGPSCASGQVCVNGGCIADQSATFACSNDGQSGQLATTCASGSICLHHDCYVACGSDSGVTCASSSHAGPGVCKNVTIETGTYSVCGSATTLGSDCDPSQGKSCSGGQVCVDGYCE